MDERIDIWDSEGRPTGRSALKSEAHRMGWWHPTVHVWVYTPQAQVLLQQRGLDKVTFPGLWDVSVAGHMGAGEAPEEAALREIQEEIGLEAVPSGLEYLSLHQEQHQHPGGITDSEFHHLFLLRVAHSGLKLIPQASEVAALRWEPLTHLAEATWGLANPGAYVPHGSAYYAKIIKEIRSRL